MGCGFVSFPKEIMLSKLYVQSQRLIARFKSLGLNISFCRTREFPDDPKATCHGEGKHSPIVAPEKLEARFQEEKIPFATKFYSQTLMLQAREKFLEKNYQIMMNKEKQGITTHWASIAMTEYAGCGIGKDGSIVHGIQVVTCGYRYVDNAWHEITIFPNAKIDKDIIFSGKRP